MPSDKPPDVEEILASLKTMIKEPVSDDELRKDIDRYLNRYLMDAESSKRAIIRDHHGRDEDYIPPQAEGRKIAELHEGDECSVSGVVIRFGGRRRPKIKELMEFTISDETGSIGVTVWEPTNDVTEGKSYTINMSKVRYRNGSIYLETNGDKVSAYSGPTIVPSAVVDVPITEYGELRIDSTVSLIATVCQLFPPSANSKAPRQKGTLKMNGGTVQFSHWGEYNLESGCSYVFRNVKVEKGYRDPIDVKLPNIASHSKVN